MSGNNTEYDFKWCPGCGDFGVRRALESALERRLIETEEPAENTVVVAGIGCSGNMVHLLEGSEPYGFHGVHGRTLPAALGIKMARPELNVVLVVGDGDFLGMGLEHIGPQAARNLDVTAVVMDNAVYGLTKGQASPTTNIDDITSSTPHGKSEQALNPLSLYLTLGVSMVTSALSSKVKDLSQMIFEGMAHPGFAIIHVQSPCTTYNDTYEQLKGNPKKGIEPLAWAIDDDHDPTDIGQSYKIAHAGGVPLGLIYRDDTRMSFHAKMDEMSAKSRDRPVQQIVDSYAI